MISDRVRVVLLVSICLVLTAAWVYVAVFS